MDRMSGIELGRRVKELRQQKGMTLKQIEARVGVSATHVSEVERGKTSPTVGALCRIAEALGVNASVLIDFPAGQEVSHTRPGERLIVTLPGEWIKVEVLTKEQPYVETSMFVVTIEPDSPRPLVREARPGDKFLLVLDGLVEVTVCGSTYLLKRGDSLHFRATTAQTFQNVGDKPAHLFWVDWPRFTL